MKKRKALQDLTIKDNFLFGAVVSREKSIVYHPEYKDVRLDIYAEDENHTHYNVKCR